METISLSNYVKGRRAEYRTQHILKSDGYYTIRAAASKGFVDVAAVRRGAVRFISVKSGSARVSKSERELLQKIADGDSESHFSVEIWWFQDGCREPVIEVL